MGKRTLGVLTVAAMTCLVGALVVGPAAGQGVIIPDDKEPALTVTKVVDAGPDAYAVTGLFTIQVSCDDVEATLTFNPDGSTHSAPSGWVRSGNSWSFQDIDLRDDTCEIVEQAGGATTVLASDPTYACTFANELYVAQAEAIGGQVVVAPGCVSTDGPTPAEVRFGSPFDDTCEVTGGAAPQTGDYTWCVQSAVVTVTNPIADDPAKVATEVVAVQPTFTG